MARWYVSVFVNYRVNCAQLSLSVPLSVCVFLSLYHRQYDLYSLLLNEQALDRESVHELDSAAQARITEVQCILTDAAKRAAAAKKGSSGSKRSSFGGGRSSGGRGGRF